jgi:transglutaminase-like putative cysteine protease
MMRMTLPLPSLAPPAHAADAACARWSLALLALALASHAPALPPPVWPALACALCARLLPQRRWTPIPRLLFLAGAVAAAGMAFGWTDSRTLRTALLLALALKWAEARSTREFALLAGGSLLAGALGLLHWGEWTGLALIVLLPLLALGALESATEADMRAGRPTPAPARATWRHIGARLAGNLGRIALALPLAAALFLFFPRIPGPLWDIGLTFGLPLSVALEKSNQGLGVSTRLKPGQNQAQTGVAENAPVLVAEFDNWVPPTSLLYWRGPVYYDFDGREWRLDPEYDAGQGRTLMRRGWTKSSAFAATLTKKSQEITYTVRLTPHDRLWLYGLDLPAALAAESFISADWQVLAHRPVKAETRYRLKSWLDWEAGGALDETLRRRALALPETGNPRLRALGAELAAQPPDGRITAALTALAKNGYEVRDRFPLGEGPDALDEFWFDRREGNADLYAGTFVFLMRAAGLPARLVTGYRGGKLMALTDFVIVKKNHAHAWAEVWDEARGWRRFDPTDMIAPPRSASAQQAKTAQPKPAGAAAPKPPPREAARNQAGHAADPQKTPVPAAGPPIAVKADSFSGLDGFFARWIFRLDGETQQSLLAGLGEKFGEKLGGALGGKFAWVWLLVGAALSSALVFALSQLIAWRREARHLPPPQRHWNRLGRLLARRGLAREPWECPGNFARRVAAARPLWAETMAALANAYTDWRYAPARPDAPRRIEACARKLHNLILADTAAPRRNPKTS